MDLNKLAEEASGAFKGFQLWSWKYLAGIVLFFLMASAFGGILLFKSFQRSAAAKIEAQALAEKTIAQEKEIERLKQSEARLTQEAKEADARARKAQDNLETVSAELDPKGIYRDDTRKIPLDQVHFSPEWDELARYRLGTFLDMQMALYTLRKAFTAQGLVLTNARDQVQAGIILLTLEREGRAREAKEANRRLFQGIVISGGAALVIGGILGVILTAAVVK